MKTRFLALLTLLTIFANAQQKHLTIKDAILGYYKGLYPNNMMGLQWLEDQDIMAYYDQQDIVLINTEGQEVDRLTASDFNQYTDLKNIPYFDKITSTNIIFRSSEAYHIYNYKDKKKIVSIKFDEKAQNQDFCVQNQLLAYTLDNNLCIASKDNPKIAVTKILDSNIVSGQTIHRSEFGITKGTFWSPQGHYLAFYQKDESHVKSYPLVDITTYPATLIDTKYPMAGEGSERAKVGIYHTKSKKTIYLDIDTSDEHYLTNLAWSPDEKYITLAEVSRAQDHLWFNVYDVKTGKKVKTIFEEQNECWVEPEMPALFLPNSSTEFLWLSEKDGFKNVYKYSLLDNKAEEQITNFDFVVTEILGFDLKAKYVLVAATGKDPKGMQLYKVNLKSKKVTQITTEQGTHLTSLSPSKEYVLDEFSSLKVPGKTGVYKLKNTDYTSIKTAQNPLVSYQLGTTRFVKLKTKVDNTPLECLEILPPNFDENKKYPVLIYVYGGPHAQLVTNTWLGGSNLWMQYLAAEQDYVVFILDNRGSENRGFKFESVIHRNQGVAAMQDQLTGVDYLSSKPYVDTNRIAVHGWSYGGFMTISLLLNYPDLFNVGVAGGPVTDWKYYEAMYGERYMDTPKENPEGYAKSRLHDKIANLKSPLLVIHGSVDDVVVPQHSMTLLKEAVEKDIPIDFFTYPMHKHNVRGMDRIHLMEKVIHYILEKNK